jgi:biotin-dependent carboxylase-like uncharacterized protein
MTAHLRVMAPGLATSLQDLGRFGHQALGVPVSGALDEPSLRVANALVGNAEDEACLEIRMIGPTLRVDAPAVRVALAGTDTQLEILSGSRVPAWRSVRLERGQSFCIGMVRDSSCAYLAVEGGFDVPAVFGSRATYARGGFGGFDGRALKEGDRLPLRLASAPRRQELRAAMRPEEATGAIRVVLGPQDDHFTAEALRTFLASAYSITPHSDRMGLRLAGPALEHRSGHDILSEGIASGSIQVPGTGQPIILLADRQTTGGYPKIATVASADLPRLGRARPGDQLRFRAVSVEDAASARRAQEAAIRACIEMLQPAEERSEAEELLSTNLISGVVWGEA